MGRLTPQLVVGLMVIAVGVLFTLDNLRHRALGLLPASLLAGRR